MAALDIIGVAHIFAKNKSLVLTTSAVDIIAAMGTGVSGKVNSLIATNVGAVTRTITVNLVLAVGPATVRLAYQLNIPTGASIPILEPGEQWLMEGDKIAALANAVTDVELSASWLELS